MTNCFSILTTKPSDGTAASTNKNQRTHRHNPSPLIRNVDSWIRFLFALSHKDRAHWWCRIGWMQIQCRALGDCITRPSMWLLPCIALVVVVVFICCFDDENIIICRQQFWCSTKIPYQFAKNKKQNVECPTDVLYLGNARYCKETSLREGKTCGTHLRC